MKRLLFTALLVGSLATLSIGGEGMQSGQQAVTITDSIAVADTASGAIKADTSFSGTVEVWKYDYIQFYCQLVGDSNFTNDSVIVRVQFSPNLSTPDWQHLADSLFIFSATSDTSFGSIYRLDTLNYLPDLMRFECVRHDVNEATAPGLLANKYNASLIIRFKGWK